MDEGRAKSNRPKDKKVARKVLHPKEDTNSMHEEKKVGGDYLAPNIAQIHPYEDSKITLNRAKKDLLQQLVTTLIK